MSDLAFLPYQAEKNLKSDSTLKSLLVEGGHSISIFGYPDDEGIHKNGGKVGAADGPCAIRSSLYKTTPHGKMNSLKIKDFGDLSFEGSSLSERHSFSSEKVFQELNSDKRVIGLGGGHDYGYVDGAAFLKKYINEDIRPLIVNFDAHFDLRNLDHGITSGTPFFRLLEDFGDSFDLLEVGIQKQCNSDLLFEFAHEQTNVITLHYDELYKNHQFQAEIFKKELRPTDEKRPCYLSVDIDGFSSSLAPGCSQSWPTGFDTASFFEMFDFLNLHFDIHILGIYEVSPPLDHTELTSRLAALIAYRFLELQA
jgi:formiminoglutamase